MENMPEERRPKLSDAGGGEDRLGALHDDILIRILLKSGDAAAAARTSVLARRWRHLWALLPGLFFYRPTDPRRIRSALAAHEAPALRALVVVEQGAPPGSAGAWLPIAARRLSGVLGFRVLRRSRSRAKKRAALKLPCFEKATKIVLWLGFLRLALPPSDVFTRLRLLILSEFWLRGPCGLGEAVSSARCPSLQRLAIKDAHGLGDLTIHSDCLIQLELSDLPDLQHLTLVAPALQLLKLKTCFSPAANISAPHLLRLEWMDGYDQNSVQLGEMACLQTLVIQHFIMYGEDFRSSHNRNGACLLRHFERLHRLVLTLQCPPDIANKKYFMEDITRLPDIKLLELGITACGHSFGASLFHVMRMCTAIRELYLGLNVTPEEEAETVCPSDCICDQPPADIFPFSEYMLPLFETPSGFTVFCFTGSLINPPKTMEDIWYNFTDSSRAKWVVLFMEFQTFEDKSSAINRNTGVNESLTEMIRTWIPGNKMAVGKPEYKEIIEERLKIDCLYNPRVMEVMWGIQNCMPSLVPCEKSQLAEEDRLPMSNGLQSVLSRYGCNVKPEMLQVNEKIVATASALSACDSVEREYSLVLRKAGDVIKDVSGISCEGWSLLKIATALRMIWRPKKFRDSCGVSKDEVLRLANDADKYGLLMNKYVCLRAYKEMANAHDVRASKKELLKSLLSVG